MSLIKRMRKQKAVYWAATGTNSYDEVVYADPVEINCRWEDIAVMYMSPAGHEQLSRSRVYVDRVVTLRGVLWLGLLADVLSEGLPLSLPGAFEIKQFEDLPNIRNTEHLLTAYL